mmetsp:Transcript_5301/g.8353  ORF Transcript_5301/g.8353 Transcript_5301/m.8353 type:complete len:183 (-) Transcript_5301:1065-1613(-)
MNISSNSTDHHHKVGACATTTTTTTTTTVGILDDGLRQHCRSSSSSSRSSCCDDTRFLLAGNRAKAAPFLLLTSRLRGGDAMEGEGGGSSSITPEQIKILEHCCLEVQRDPSLLQKPEFKFFKLFITHMAPTLRSEDDNKEKVGEKKQIFDDGTGHQFANVGHDGEEVVGLHGLGSVHQCKR